MRCRRAHTLTVLFILTCVLGYVTLLEETPRDTAYNTKRYPPGPAVGEGLHSWGSGASRHFQPLFCPAQPWHHRPGSREGSGVQVSFSGAASWGSNSWHPRPHLSVWQVGSVLMLSPWAAPGHVAPGSAPPGCTRPLRPHWQMLLSPDAPSMGSASLLEWLMAIKEHFACLL